MKKFQIPNYKYPLFKIYCPKNIGKKIEIIFKKGAVSEGYHSEKFENKFAEFLEIDKEKCVLLNSATSALTLAYRLINLKEGDEVISTPLTCPATNEPLFNSGVKIRFADIDKKSGNIDPESVKRLINKKTKAIIAVHWAGQPADIQSLKKIIGKRKIKIIEDAAHALGAKLDNRFIGNHGDFICFSFQAVKHMTTGDGGALICKNKKDANLAKKLRWFGVSRNYKGNKWKQDIKDSGYKFHTNDLSSVIGLEQLKTMNKKIRLHKKNGTFFDKNIKNKKISILKRLNNSESSHWIYTVLVDKKDKFKNYLKKFGIRSDEVHFRNDKYTIFKRFKESNLPGMDYFEKHMISIPVGWWLNNKDIKFIIKKLNNYQ